jgi:hypothetical protein
MDVVADSNRPPVFLDAAILDSLNYARAMLALHDVVSSNLLPQERDHSAYQEWVYDRYLEELGVERKLPALLSKREKLRAQQETTRQKLHSLHDQLESTDFGVARQKYWDWLYKRHAEAWNVLDPVVSIHPDCLIFEVFSQDESSYGRVTVPRDKLEVSGEIQYGTTNIDYSLALAREMSRVRSYRPAWLKIGADEVLLATSAGHALEKKIDLPDSWLKAFSQVQSAASFDGVTVHLSPSTLSEVLDTLHRNREKQSPRSLRFTLRQGEKPTISIDPWGTQIDEHTHRYGGSFDGEIRIWGRRRLFLLEQLLPCAESLQVKLLGSGMPSYWSVDLGGHRFDLGISGWTSMDWASAARFDLMAARQDTSDSLVQSADSALQDRLHLTPEALSEMTDLSLRQSGSALRILCRRGQAMFDPSTGEYRWRRIVPFEWSPDQDDESSDTGFSYAKSLLEKGAVSWTVPPVSDDNGCAYTASVKGQNELTVKLSLNLDGAVTYAECTCSWFRREKLKKGPCAHIIAATLLASEDTLTA